MDINAAPTKGNLMQIDKTLELSRNGHALMDRKRMILVNEIMTLAEEAKTIQGQMQEAYAKAYQFLSIATHENGILSLYEAATTVPESDNLSVRVRSVMGSEVPVLSYKSPVMKPAYSLMDTTIAVDKARMAFQHVVELQVSLAQVENAAYRLAKNIQKTQKRVNALQNISIPQLEKTQRSIQDALEEKEREEFTRLKVVKRILAENK